MEDYFRRVEFGMASHQRRRHSLSRQTEEIRPIVDAQKSGIRGREKLRRRSDSSWLRPPAEEMPAMPEQAIEFLSRTWSTCSSDLLQIILSPACTSRLPRLLLGSASSAPRDEDGEPADDVVSKDEDGDQEKKKKHNVCLEPGLGGGHQSLDENQTRGGAVVDRGTPPPRPHLPRRNKITQPTCWKLNTRHVTAILRGFLLSAVSAFGSKRRRRSRRKDEARLHAAQAHAAVSVAQLAAAVAGMVSACELRPPAPERNRAAADPAAAGDRRTGAALASAAALVATVCAEAATESGRVDAARVASAMRAGSESRSHADLLALTATAATSLRGAAALELRAADMRRIGGGTNSADSVAASLQKGITLRVCLPCGRVRVRTVAIFPHIAVVVLRLGKKLLRGAVNTYKEYEVLAVSSSGNDAMMEGQPFFPLALSTAGGATMQLMFERQAHCKVWTTSIQGMLSEQKAQAPHA